MSAVEIKAQINKYLDEVDDSFLKVVYSMLDTYVKGKDDPIIGYDIKGNPLHASVAKKRYEKDLKAVEKGEFTTTTELREISKKWLNPTK